MMIRSDRSDVVLEQVQIASEITITLRATSPTASCPSYGTLSKGGKARQRKVQGIGGEVWKHCGRDDPSFTRSIPGYGSMH